MGRFEEDRDHQLYYRRSIAHYGIDDVRALHWNSSKTQEVRFEQLVRVGELQKKTILDLGCGTGDFRKFLHKKNIQPSSYTGIDFLPEFVDKARLRHPSDRWICDDFFSFTGEFFDIILCNGALNVKKRDNMAFLKSFLLHFLPMTKEALAITLLKYAEGYASDPMIYTYNIQPVRDLLEELGKPFHIHEGYIDNDFTCFIYRGVLPRA